MPFCVQVQQRQFAPIFMRAQVHCAGVPWCGWVSRASPPLTLPGPLVASRSRGACARRVCVAARVLAGLRRERTDMKMSSTYAAAIEKGMNAACLQRMNSLTHAKVPQRQVHVEMGSLRTTAHACAAAALPATAKLLRHAQLGSCPAAAAGSWCLDETLHSPSGHRA